MDLLSPLLPDKTMIGSNTSSVMDDFSKLNTEETKRSEDLSDPEGHPAHMDRFEYYAKFKNTKPLFDSKVSGHICQLEEKYKVHHFCEAHFLLVL